MAGPISPAQARVLAAQAADATRSVHATGVVTKVEPGRAADGRAEVTVVWNGTEIAAAYNAGYAPTTGDVVLLAVTSTAGGAAQAVIVCHLVGTPSIPQEV